VETGLQSNVPLGVKVNAKRLQREFPALSKTTVAIKEVGSQ